MLKNISRSVIVDRPVTLGPGPKPAYNAAYRIMSTFGRAVASSGNKARFRFGFIPRGPGTLEKREQPLVRLVTTVSALGGCPRVRAGIGGLDSMIQGRVAEEKMEKAKQDSLTYCRCDVLVSESLLGRNQSE